MSVQSRVSITLHCRARFSPALKNILKSSALLTLQNIPIGIFKKNLPPDSKCTISIAIVGPKTIQKLNVQYRNKNKPTDVLSFSRMETPLSKFSFPQTDLGDVLICWDIAKKQAQEYRVSISAELSRLTVHGVLHLFGFDHEKTKREAIKMFRLQEKILKKLDHSRIASIGSKRAAFREGKSVAK
ncbi:MAG: rRNA maturation RNase YbeY [Bdellovibrionales bacterium]|nr:rRNA maturation RNase YbeY [Bdellovibrionales bacterium]